SIVLPVIEVEAEQAIVRVAPHRVVAGADVARDAANRVGTRMREEELLGQLCPALRRLTTERQPLAVHELEEDATEDVDHLRVFEDVRVGQVMEGLRTIDDSSRTGERKRR